MDNDDLKVKFSNTLWLKDKFTEKDLLKVKKGEEEKEDKKDRFSSEEIQALRTRIQRECLVLIS